MFSLVYYIIEKNGDIGRKYCHSLFSTFKRVAGNYYATGKEFVNNMKTLNQIGFFRA